MIRIILMIASVINISACAPRQVDLVAPPAATEPDTPTNPEPPANDMKVTIGSTTFTATFVKNDAAAAFSKLLPLTLNMNEINGNEKYASLPSALPTIASNVGTIRSGNIMVYGSRTLVLFYKTFSTSYSYTAIATLDDPADLQSALGQGSATITFTNN